MAGKPKKPEEVKEYMLRVRMTHAEHELLEQAAKSLSLGVSSWARSELVQLAQLIVGKK
jgi:uncharacterized protein (DUF1778 family)